MKRVFVLLPILFLGFYIMFPDMAFATTEHATFESIYKESSSIGWIVAGLFALVAGAVIIATGGTASPIVVGIGSWVGGLMGLSGIAATNAGLALLGGGSIAAGGFGIIGGAAVITAALSFSTDVVFDYTIGKAMSTYSYSKLEESSKNMVTLPMPVNESGSDSYEDALDILKAVNQEESISNNANQQAIEKAIRRLDKENEALDINNLLKNETLLSLLYFISNDYKNAKEHSEAAIKYARAAKLRRTLPAFIYSASSIYDEQFDFTGITRNYFRYSVLAEPENPLIPLLFSIYLDRLTLRVNDGYLDEVDLLNKIFLIMKDADLKDYYLQDYTIILARYFVQLKLDQQKISYLATASNDKIKRSPKTLAVVNESFTEYKNLLNGANMVMNEMLLLQSSDDESRDKVAEFHALLIKYIQDSNRLENLIVKFKAYQAEHVGIEKNEKSEWISNLLIIGVFIVLLIGILQLTRKKQSAPRG